MEIGLKRNYVFEKIDELFIGILEDRQDKKVHLKEFNDTFWFSEDINRNEKVKRFLISIAPILLELNELNEINILAFVKKGDNNKKSSYHRDIFRVLKNQDFEGVVLQSRPLAIHWEGRSNDTIERLKRLKCLLERIIVSIYTP